MQQLGQKDQERQHGTLQSNQGSRAKQRLPGTPEILGTMFWPTKKDLKTAMEVFALFQWALSALVIGESSSYSGQPATWVCLVLKGLGWYDAQ